MIAMKLFLSIALFCLLPEFMLAQTGNTQQVEVMMKMAMLRNALLTKDSASLDKLLAADVSYGHSNGLVQTKAQLIHSVMSGEQDYKSIEPSDMTVRLYENTGIVNMKAAVTMIYGGNPLDLKMAITLAWIKKDGDWKLVARQSVKL